MREHFDSRSQENTEEQHGSWFTFDRSSVENLHRKAQALIAYIYLQLKVEMAIERLAESCKQ